MKVTFDPFKRDATFADRGLDFADAARVLEGAAFTTRDDRFDYVERRMQTYGTLDGRMVMIVWIPEEDGIRVISMRHCHEKEQRQYRSRMG